MNANVLCVRVLLSILQRKLSKKKFSLASKRLIGLGSHERKAKRVEDNDDDDEWNELYYIIMNDDINESIFRISEDFTKNKFTGRK